MSDEDQPGGTTDLLAGTGEIHVVDQFRLRVVNGPDAGMVFESAGERVLVGTHESNDLVLTDPAVSRFHCEIVAGQERIRLRDVDSRNGTLLDGVSVMDAFLRHGSRLMLGRTEVLVETGAVPISIPMSKHTAFGRMVGGSRAMRAVFATLERAATSSSTVLLLGETGTGKDIAAEMVHTSGSRSQGPFVVVDCGSLPPSLMESELFGHEKGAFTGADRVRQGAFEAASGGTLFFDEIGELPWDLQPKLLRALESRQVQRIGSTVRVPVDVRVVAATSRNLWAEVNARRFRPDLYYRLAVIKVVIPPLRERLDDVVPLVGALLASMGADEKTIKALQTPELILEICRHPWPGNVRELRNYLERCMVLEHAAPFEDPTEDGDLAIHADLPLAVARDRVMRAFERRYAQELLRQHEDNVSAAARAAGIDRKSMHRLLARCGLRAKGAER
jgi:DNA-binding NtrC family response regulator